LWRGFVSERRELTIGWCRSFFPGAVSGDVGMVALGFNSHRKFLLSYTAPVVWNLAIIAALIFFGSHSGNFDEVQMGQFQATGSSNCMGLSHWQRTPFTVQLPPCLAGSRAPAGV